MAEKYDMTVFVGRIQPFHLGHKTVIQTALEISKRICVLVGSANSPRSHRNPFNFQERKNMILGSFGVEDQKRIIVLPLEDAVYNDSLWVRNVQSLVNNVLSVGSLYLNSDEISESPSIALIGHSKDDTSYYLKLFPQWKSVEVPSYRDISGTNIRNSYFSNIGHMWVVNADGHRPGDTERDAYVTSHVRDFLDSFLKTEDYKKISEEYEFIAKYKLAWANSPYPPIFVTVDSIVIQSGHVLLVKRGALPGKGLWAIPGGFINQNERIEDAAIRELREETGIKVPEPVLRGSIVAKEVFDSPTRSSRGRTITHAFLFKLRDDITLPKVKGMDDAEKAKWVPLGNLNPEQFYEDHYHLIGSMVGKI
jgi:bifunctional NMN adenylyltransferase/nudix hydrolase